MRLPCHLEQVEKQSKYEPCILCGELHPLRVHEVLGREIRTGEEENTAILIISIYCIRAKRKGVQYTKRILPVFVIPECNICLENVWRYIERYPDDEIHYEEAGIILGSYDNRTIRKHILLARQMIERVKLTLMSVLAAIQTFTAVPELKAGEHAHQHFSVLMEHLAGAAQRMGVVDYDVSEMRFIHGAYVFEKSRSQPKTTLNRVFSALLFFDTS